MKKTNKKKIKKATVKKCQHKEFFAHQNVSMEVVVDSNGNFVRGGRIYDSENPFGPYGCVVCGESFDELPSKKEINKESLMDFVYDHVTHFGCVPIEYAEYDRYGNEIAVYDFDEFTPLFTEEECKRIDKLIDAYDKAQGGSMTLRLTEKMKEELKSTIIEISNLSADTFKKKLKKEQIDLSTIRFICNLPEEEDESDQITFKTKTRTLSILKYALKNHKIVE